MRWTRHILTVLIATLAVFGAVRVVHWQEAEERKREAADAFDAAYAAFDAFKAQANHLANEAERIMAKQALQYAITTALSVLLILILQRHHVASAFQRLAPSLGANVSQVWVDVREELYEAQDENAFVRLGIYRRGVFDLTQTLARVAFDRAVTAAANVLFPGAFRP